MHSDFLFCWFVHEQHISFVFFSIVQQIIDFFRSQDYFSFSIYFVQFLLNDRSVKSFVQKNCSLKNHSFSKVFFPKKSLFLDRQAFSADYKWVSISLYTHISILTNTQWFKEYRYKSGIALFAWESLEIKLTVPSRRTFIFRIFQICDLLQLY